jgi:hypothetical protein
MDNPETDDSTDRQWIVARENLDDTIAIEVIRIRSSKDKKCHDKKKRKKKKKDVV